MKCLPVEEKKIRRGSKLREPPMTSDDDKKKNQKGVKEKKGKGGRSDTKTKFNCI